MNTPQNLIHKHCYRSCKRKLDIENVDTSCNKSKKTVTHHIRIDSVSGELDTSLPAELTPLADLLEEKVDESFESIKSKDTFTKEVPLFTSTPYTGKAFFFNCSFFYCF